VIPPSPPMGISIICKQGMQGHPLDKCLWPMAMLRASVTHPPPSLCLPGRWEVGRPYPFFVLPTPPAATRRTAHHRHRRLLLPARGSSNDPGPRRPPVCIFLALDHVLGHHELTSYPSPAAETPEVYTTAPNESMSLTHYSYFPQGQSGSARLRLPDNSMLNLLPDTILEEWIGPAKNAVPCTGSASVSRRPAALISTRCLGCVVATGPFNYPRSHPHLTHSDVSFWR